MSSDTGGGQHDGHLGAVYAAKSPDEIARHYDAWAGTYDSEMAASGYRHPSIALALMARHVVPGPAPILDAGAGTGLVGEWLVLVGYPHVEGLDISAGMLAQAERKGVYAKLHKLPLGGDLPFADASFGAVISTGVFTTGHVGHEALPELIRLTKPGGALILTVKDTVWEAGFQAAIADAVTAGQVALAEETAPYVSMPGDAATVMARCVALRRL